MGEEGFSGDGDDSKSLWTGMIFFLVGSSVASLYDGRLDWEPASNNDQSAAALQIV